MESANIRICTGAKLGPACLSCGGLVMVTIGLICASLLRSMQYSTAREHPVMLHCTGEERLLPLPFSHDGTLGRASTRHLHRWQVPGCNSGQERPEAGSLLHHKLRCASRAGWVVHEPIRCLLVNAAHIFQ